MEQRMRITGQQGNPRGNVEINNWGKSETKVMRSRKNRSRITKRYCMVKRKGVKM